MNGTHLALGALAALAAAGASRQRGSSSRRGRWTYDVTYSVVWWPDGQDYYESDNGYEQEDVELDLDEPDEVAKVLGLDEDYFDDKPEAWARVPEWLKASVALGLVAVDMGVIENNGDWWSTESQLDMYSGHEKSLALHPGHKKPGRRSLRGGRVDSGNSWPEQLGIVMELMVFEPMRPWWRKDGSSRSRSLSDLEKRDDERYVKHLREQELKRATLRHAAGLGPRQLPMFRQQEAILAPQRSLERRGARATMTPRVGQRVLVRQKAGSDVVWRMRIAGHDSSSHDEYVTLEDDAGYTVPLPWHAWRSEVLPYPGDMQWGRMAIVDEDLGTRRWTGSFR